MSTQLDKLTIKGFKSIRELEDFEMKNLNVIVGANGAGKSNLISFFKMLRSLINDNLSNYVSDNGGASDLLFNGEKTTPKMSFSTRFGARGFRFTLAPTPSDSCSIESEARYYSGGRTGWWELGDSYDGKSKMVAEVTGKRPDASYSQPVYDEIASWMIYHFHDTSATAPMRKYEIVEDDAVLRTDAANIGPFLKKLKTAHETQYKEIVNAIRLVTPFFDDFVLKPREFGVKQKVNISWLQKGSDYPMQPYHLSDGSIRFICLATALLQPNPPSTIIIDEPELGLHPAAIDVLAELIQQASQRTQVIVATQSPALIDQFAIEDIVVVNRKDGASTFERLNPEDFSQWLESYSVGELWTKNVIAGGRAMSKFIEVIAIVEGKTEQVFIESVLQPYLAAKMIFISATQITKPGQKGGDVRFVRAQQDIGNHLKQRGDTFVTTFIDYYGTKEWPGLGTLAPGLTPTQISTHLHDATLQAVNELFGETRSDERFIPYVAMHEFESLLFSDSEILASEMGIDEKLVTAILTECGEPESINNSPATAPSKRLENLSPYGTFAKTRTGIAIAQRIGIQKMREKCPLFNYWLEELEAKLEEQNEA